MVSEKAQPLKLLIEMQSPRHTKPFEKLRASCAVATRYQDSNGAVGDTLRITAAVLSRGA